MKQRLISLLAVSMCLVSVAAHAGDTAPRDIWSQAAASADAGNIDAAAKKTSELMEVGKLSGIRTYPQYAASAAILARQTAQSNKPVADWANKAADTLDPGSSAVAFIRAEEAVESKSWGAAIPLLARGIAGLFSRYRSRLLARSDTVITLLLALALTTAIFSLALLIRYGRAMTHDFREMLGERLHGGSVSVLAFALLFLPVFLWLGPLWLVFYWFIIFFGYAKTGERITIVVLSLLLAGAPLVLDWTSQRIAGIDSPVVMSAITSDERTYEPDALRRMQELVNIVPDDAMLHLLLGTLYLQDGNDQQASQHYQRSAEIHDNAGALDPRLAIAFYDESIALGELYKFDQQAQKLDQAKRIDRASIERLSSESRSQKLEVVLYHPTISQAWAVSSEIAERGVARSLFGNYAWFDPVESLRNPLTAGAILALVLAPLLFLKRRRAGFAGSCFKCGRTFCLRCKSARESTTFCTQCIHIYLKRDGVSAATKRAKLEEVNDHQHAVLKRNRWLATFLPGSAQVLEGHTVKGVVASFAFAFFVSLAILSGRLAPVLAPGDTAKTIVRIVAIVLAAALWLFITLPVYRRNINSV